MAAINNLGPGLGSVAANYATVSDLGKVILCIAMLLRPTRNIHAADLIHDRRFGVHEYRAVLAISDLAIL